MKRFLLRRLTSIFKIFFVLLWLINGTELFAQGVGLVQCYADKDQDGFGDPNDWVWVDASFGCPLFDTRPGSSNGLDCDDNDKDINPFTVWYKDQDNDGFRTAGSGITTCTRPPGYKLKRELHLGDGQTVNLSCGNGIIISRTFDN